MNIKKVISELSKIEMTAFNLRWDLNVMETNETEQKSKRTGKTVSLCDCRVRQIYRTYKDGCPGIEGDTECLGCEFRR